MDEVDGTGVVLVDVDGTGVVEVNVDVDGIGVVEVEVHGAGVVDVEVDGAGVVAVSTTYETDDSLSMSWMSPFAENVNVIGFETCASVEAALEVKPAVPVPTTVTTVCGEASCIRRMRFSSYSAMF